MVERNFPYGNDPSDPDSWAFRTNNYSKEWYICYHSGKSLLCGMHTFLLFGTENLTAAVINFVGCGIEAKWGAEKTANAVGASEGVSKAAGTLEDGYEKYSYNKAREEVENLDSAKGIYDLISKNGQICSSIIPFRIEDLAFKSGDIAGVDVSAALAAGNYYSLLAPPLFAAWTARNVSREPSTVSAGLGVSKGFFIPAEGKIFSLWTEIAQSETEEYPFRDYNIHPLFKNWRSASYTNKNNSDNYDMQNKVLNQLSDDMVKNPAKYRFKDSRQAEDFYREIRGRYDDSGRDVKEIEGFMPWIDRKNKHLFYQ